MQVYLRRSIQVLVEGPGSSATSKVPRHAAPLSNVVLTPIVISKLTRAARSGVVKKEWLAAEVEKKWEASSWAKKRDQKERRRALTDFDRFKVMKLRKQVGFTLSQGWPLRGQWPVSWIGPVYTPMAQT